jgi:hypothetical protein
MKNTNVFILAGAIALTVIASAFISSKNSNKTNAPAEKGFAVVELFTSEGCSSCPPADALVAKLEKESAGKPIYILAFHVDYWDRLGWKDAFSDAAFTKRQQTYDRLLKSEVYTPQIVVNGKTSFVGSEEGDLHNAVNKGLGQEAPATLRLDNITNTPGAINVHYDVKGNNNHSVLVLALVQHTAQTKVMAGENKGRTLSHVQIVQKLQTVPLTINKSGVEKITLPNGSSASNNEIIGLVQDTNTGEILAASRIGLGGAI